MSFLGSRSITLAAGAGSAVCALLAYLATLPDGAAWPRLAGHVLSPVYSADGHAHAAIALGFAGVHTPHGAVRALVQIVSGTRIHGALNVVAALCAAVSVPLVVSLARRLGSSMPAAVGCALAMAFGPLFWAEAIVWGGHHLHLALVCGAFVLLLGARADPPYRQPVGLGLIGLAALGHGGAVFATPAALAACARKLRQPWWIAGVLLAGAGAFGFHWTHASAAAGHPGDAIPVGIASAPGVLSREMSPLGFALAIAGAGVLIARRPPGWAAIAAGGVLLAAAARVPIDVYRPCLLLALGLAWPVAALGIDWVARQQRRTVLAAVLLAVALPALQLALNWPPSDRSGESTDPWGLESVATALQARPTTFLPTEAPALDGTLLARFGADRELDIRLVPPIPEVIEHELGAGRQVVGLRRARSLLEERGVRFAWLADVDVQGSSGSEPAELMPGPASRVLAVTDCVNLSAEWTDITALLGDGRVVIAAAAVSADIDVAVGSDRPMRPVLLERRGMSATLNTSAAPPAGTWKDAVGIAHSYTIDGHLEGGRTLTFLVGGAGGLRGAARVRAGSDADACSAPLAPRSFFEEAEWQREILPSAADAAFFGAGWHQPEGDDYGPFAWSASERATLLVPLVRSEEIEVTVHGMAADPDPDNEIALIVNGTRLSGLPTGAGLQQYRWVAPAAVWRAGANEIVISVDRLRSPAETGSPDTRLLGLALRRVTLERRDDLSAER